jgi:hypothetical protein
MFDARLQKSLTHPSHDPNSGRWYLVRSDDLILRTPKLCLSLSFALSVEIPATSKTAKLPTMASQSTMIALSPFSPKRKPIPQQRTLRTLPPITEVDNEDLIAGALTLFGEFLSRPFFRVARFRFSVSISLPRFDLRSIRFSTLVPMNSLLCF